MVGYTEAEARELACPVNPRDRCSASDCMAWRWVSALSVDNPSRQPGMARQEVARGRGYCGLAGKP